MITFNTLLQREWLQYRRGWIALVAVPVLLLLALVPVSQVEGLDAITPELIAGISALLTIALVMALTLGACFYQLMGLARRDQQDRSVEFWASLPGSDSASVAAPLLAHGLLMPLAALALASLGGVAVGAAMALRELGGEGLAQMQWGALLAAAGWLTLRVEVGLVLAALWLAPIVLALMAASAWLKRWGAPLLVIGLTAFTKLYDAHWLKQFFATQLQGVRVSIVAGADGMPLENIQDSHEAVQQFYDALYEFPSWVPHDLVAALRHAVAEPQFALGLLVAAGCFALMVWQRKRAL